MTLLFQVRSLSWLDVHRDYLSEGLRSSVCASDPLSDVTFVCAGGEAVEWRGRNILEAVSSVVRASPWASASSSAAAVVLIPSRRGSLVRKVLLLLSGVPVDVAKAEMPFVYEVFNDLGVRKD